MPMPAHATLDRRIAVVDGTADQKRSLQRVSDLRALPFVVLLGEPGIGKSTVLGDEAAHAGVPLLKVRALMTGARVEPGAALYLDALDEYRADGQVADKAYRLANAILAAKAGQWRLTCRSEDWRKGADMAPIQQTTGDKSIVVVQLLPLDHTEAAAILTSLGESNPDDFMSKAKSFGALGLTESSAQPSIAAQGGI
jgi:hypothetical protein